MLSRQGIRLSGRALLALKRAPVFGALNFGHQPQHLRLLTPTFIRNFSVTSVPEQQKYEFQAETRKLLDIVTHSIYTDKEVFVRELVSNASDALEKRRYKQVIDTTSSSASDAMRDSSPLEINILTDETNKTLTIIDNGIGMTKDDLVSNLGTIARSGSKQFVEQLKSTGSSRDGDGIIGQFGIGFYSSFMVSNEVSVESRPYNSESTGGFHWNSDGSGEYTVASVDDASIGSKITMKLKDDCVEYSNPDRIKDIIKRYSNFVAFPIRLNGELVNTVSAIWTQDKNSVTEEQYKDFYKFISNAFDAPLFTLHFRADAPIDLKALFFIPTFHGEKFGMGRIEPGVNLYSRKVLIETKPKDILPEWLRFIKGVVDSEDLPLSLSREKPQDSNLLRRIRDVLTRKIIRFLEEKATNEPEKFKEFYIEFNYFLKEGICQDFTFQEPLSKLLMFESSLEENKLVSFDDYISRCTPEQKDIYYLVAPSREAAFNSPYYETFKKHKKEVLFLYNAIDDFVMSNLRMYSNRKLISAEKSSIKLDEPTKDSDEEKTDEKKDEDTDTEKSEKLPELSQLEAEALCTWLKTSLGSKVRIVRTTDRLSDSPAIVTDHESGALRRMLRAVEQTEKGKSAMLPPQILEINSSHPIVVQLHEAHESNPDIAILVAEQLFDNALIAAGLIDDPRSMLPRLNDLLRASLKK